MRIAIKIVPDEGRHLIPPLCVIVYLLTGCLEVDTMEAPCTPKPGERQICYLDFTPEVDGNLDDGAWDVAHWEQVNYKMSKDRFRPDDNNDASFKFACVADKNNLYFGFKVRDDKLSAVFTESVDGGEPRECEYYKDDSLEIVMDQDTEVQPQYGGNDFQIVFKPQSIGEDGSFLSTKLKVGGCAEDNAIKGAKTDSQGQCKRVSGGWFAEIEVPLKIENDTKGWRIDPADGRIIHFQTGYNDNDGIDGRDHKLTWGKSDRYEDDSFRNPALLDELELCRLPGSQIDADSE
jgi:hypothetical protein